MRPIHHTKDTVVDDDLADLAPVTEGPSFRSTFPLNTSVCTRTKNASR